MKNLVESGFSINTHNNQGNTPLHLAVLYNQRELFDYILTVEDVRIDAENFRGLTPLMCAVSCGQIYFSEQLLEKGASVDVRYIGESSLLHEVDNLETALMLLERNIDINSVDSYGKSPLYTACEIGAYEIACMLLCHGADCTIECCKKLPLAATFLTCPLFFQEILFDFTFHENEKCAIYLGMLIEAVSSPLLFDKILKKSSRFLFDESAFSHLTSVLDKLPFETFKQIVSQCSDNFVEELTIYIVCGERYKFFQNSEVLDYLTVFSREAYFRDTFQFESLFSANVFVEKKFEFPEATLNNIFYLLLSYGSNLSFCDLKSIYNRQGFSDFFETMLHMEVCGFLLFPYTAVSAIYNVKLDLITLENLFIEFPQQKRRLSEFSLLELSLNAARNHIMTHYGLANCGQFLATVKRLDIPIICKDILILKRSLSKSNRPLSKPKKPLSQP